MSVVDCFQKGSSCRVETCGMKIICQIYFSLFLTYNNISFIGGVVDFCYFMVKFRVGDWKMCISAQIRLFSSSSVLSLELD